MNVYIFASIVSLFILLGSALQPRSPKHDLVLSEHGRATYVSLSSKGSTTLILPFKLLIIISYSNLLNLTYKERHRPLKSEFDLSRFLLSSLWDAKAEQIQRRFHFNTANCFLSSRARTSRTFTQELINLRRQSRMGKPAPFRFFFFPHLTRSA